MPFHVSTTESLILIKNKQTNKQKKLAGCFSAVNELAPCIIVVIKQIYELDIPCAGRGERMNKHVLACLIGLCRQACLQT